MRTHRLTPRLRFLSWMALASAFVAVSPAQAQTAAALYERAQAREADARQAAAPALASLRSVAASYETVVRRYPRSGYADNALWQAGTLYEWAFELGGQARDRNQATRVFAWLAKEYPTSTLAKQSAAKLKATPAAPPAATAADSAPPLPTGSATAQATRPTTARPTAPAVDIPPIAPGASALPNQILPAPITLLGISVSPLPKGDRLVLELSHESVYTTAKNAATGSITLQLSNVGLSAQALTAVSAMRGSLIESVRLMPKNGGTEVDIRVIGQPRHSAFPLYGPYRLVVDVETDAAPSTPGVPVATAAPAPPAAAPAEAVAPPRAAALGSDVAALPPASPTRRPSSPTAPESRATPAPRVPVAPATPSAGGYSLARQLGLGVSRVVIDPGHGGHDPGAQAHGLSEAELVLDVALRLERLLLAQPGFEVVLTRRTNEFVALEERTARANRESADLLLSIHANSSPQTATRGVETYFLNFASNDQAEAVAARENAASAQAMRLLPGLVKAITLNNKRTESREFAGMVQTALVRQMKTQNKNVKDLGVKQAPFLVLIGAEMPSVLAEISFITNRTDAGLLKQSGYRQRVAQALADAVLRYQGSLKKGTPVATTAAGR